jgi:polyhydroxyalkanoate synthase
MTGQSNDPAQFMANLLQAGQDMMKQFAGTGAAPDAKTDPAAQFMAASKHFAEMQQNYIQQVSGFWSGMLGAATSAEAAAAPPAKDGDKRFAAESWRDDPRFDLLKRTYLAYSGFLQDSVDSASMDEKTKGQLRFAVRQFTDAMSPANFFATNPEAVQLAMETGGQSLTEGMGLFFQDLAEGRISMTDESVFEVGKNLALTEGAVIFENELIQLIQYSPRSDQVSLRPLVVIPPCINKFYILDLQPENSLIRYALEQGNTVFLVSWRNITPELGHLTWDDYLEMGVMQAIDVALDISHADQVSTLGFCVGGTLLASAIAIMKARGENKVASLTLLTAMLDFFDTGEIGVLVSEQSLAAREAAIGTGGVMEGKELAFVFSSLRANDLIWPYVVNSYLKGKGPPAFDLLYWNSDGTNLPGPMFCWYVRNTYLENNLREPGKTIQCGVAVDLSKIDMPAFLYASREDHIVPWHTAYASAGLLSGDTTFVLGASGHIAGVINPPAKNKRNYWADGVSGADAEKWLSSARSVPGSWWPNWTGWLEQQGGPKVPPRTLLGNEKYRSIEPAPGRYVKARADSGMGPSSVTPDRLTDVFQDTVDGPPAALNFTGGVEHSSESVDESSHAPDTRVKVAKRPTAASTRPAAKRQPAAKKPTAKRK